MKLSTTFTLIALSTALVSVQASDTIRPEGWATCSSVYTAGDYDLNGGNDGSLIVLRNDGTDMRKKITDAVLTHDVIVFDGVDGDFMLSSFISFQSLEGRTLIGVNGARLCTTYSVTQEVRDMLDELDVNSLSQNAADNLGGTLSNGAYVAELRELTIRQAMIDRFGDPTEKYRNSGVFMFNGCSNIIVRNLDFYGPGSIDVGGADLLTLNGSDHIWVDHCGFTDGMDGNLDIVNNSDFVTVSDTYFSYTDKSYNHPLSNLNSGTELTDGSPQKNNISWIRCLWGEGCGGRMPLTNLGIHHLLNCYWDCSKGTCIDAHKQSRLLIEKSYFTSKIGKALAVREDNVQYDWRGSVWIDKTPPTSNAEVSVPYSYTSCDVHTLPIRIKSAGPTLSDPYTKSLTSTPSAIDFGKIYADNQVDYKFNLSAFGSEVPSLITLTAPDGILLSVDPDGEYASSITIEATDAKLIQADVYLKACFARPGTNELTIEASADGERLSIPVRADVIGVGGERTEVTLKWPLDMGASGNSEAEVSSPEGFTGTTMTLGEKIYIHSTHRLGDSQTFTLFNPTEAISKVPDGDCCIVFDIATAPGYVFVPKKLRFDAARVGTDMCMIDVESSRDSGMPLRLVSGLQPARSSDTPAWSEVELPLNNAGIGESLRIRIYLYNMLANKQLALANVRIEGDLYNSESAITTITADNKGEDTEYYDLMGRRTTHPQSGKLYLKLGEPDKARVVLHQ